MMEYGYRGRILDVDLTEKKFQTGELSREDTSKFIGGSGFNAWLLYKNLEPTTDALDPKNPLIFGAGPLVGTTFPTSARSTFTALSPLTGIFGDSNGGGFFGAMIKRSGCDHVIIRGISDNPCYLVIGPDGGCKIKDAADLWGKDTLTTERILKARHPRATVSSIGPAGENMVRYATIMSNHNANSYSRSGMGAVMGSKKLKAIVALGGEKIAVKDPDALQEISRRVKRWTEEFAFPKLFSRYGTLLFINVLEALGLMYGENWRRKINLDDITSLDVAAYLESVESKAHGCFRCPLKCGKHWRIKGGPYRGEGGYGYEVAHLISFGLNLGLRDISTVLHLVKAINLVGIDINEFCGTVGMATDAQKRGILNKGISEGLELDWGNPEIIETLIKKVAYREGLGDVLAEGTKGAAEKIGGGAERYALHMKGMHWPGHSAPPFVLAFSVSTRGGDFLKGMPHLLLQSSNREIAGELFGALSETSDIYSSEAKGRAVWWHENYQLINDCLGICFYLGQTLLPHGRMFPEHLAQAFRCATGVDADGAELLLSGERGHQIERAINALRGVDRSQDTFTRRPEADSWAKGIDLGAPGMLDEYYAYRGLSQNGLLTRKRLEEVGLDAVIVDLERKSVLGSPQDRDYLPLERIINNPSGEDGRKGLKAKIQDKVITGVMEKMTRDPAYIRKYFRQVGRKRRIKEWFREKVHI